MKVSIKNTAAVRRCAVTIAAAGLALALPATAMAAPVRVMVDPGHGGKDPGAVQGNVVEKKINIEMSRAVVKEARRQGWKVGMTRNSDKYIPLVQRAKKASTYDADVLVSMHVNSTGKAKKGMMTIYRGKKSKRLGKAIMKELAPLTSYKDIGNRADVRGLAVLRASKKPAVIVEVMSVTAPQERDRIRDPKVQKQVAQAIVKGIAKYEGVKYKAPAKPKAKPKPKTTPVTELTSTSRPKVPAAKAAKPETATADDARANGPRDAAAPKAEAPKAQGFLARLVELLVG